MTALTAVALSGVSVGAARPFAGKHDDPGWVCIDETAGTVVALVGLSGWPWVVALVGAACRHFQSAPESPPQNGFPGSGDHSR